MKPFVPDELWDERVRLMSAMPMEAIDAWTKVAKQLLDGVPVTIKPYRDGLYIRTYVFPLPGSKGDEK